MDEQTQKALDNIKKHLDAVAKKLTKNKQKGKPRSGDNRNRAKPGNSSKD